MSPKGGQRAQKRWLAGGCNLIGGAVIGVVQCLLQCRQWPLLSESSTSDGKSLTCDELGEKRRPSPTKQLIGFLDGLDVAVVVVVAVCVPNGAICVSPLSECIRHRRGRGGRRFSLSLRLSVVVV